MPNPPHEKQAIKETFRKLGLTKPCPQCQENDVEAKDAGRPACKATRKPCDCCHACRIKCTGGKHGSDATS